MKKIKITILGLGYVGLPLAIAFGKKYDVLGYDKDKKRIKELKMFYDSNGEHKKNIIKNSKYLKFTYDISDLKASNIFILTLPTPIYKNKKPDLSIINHANKSIGKILKKDDIVVYESTVYPGATEEVFVPILEKHSKLIYNKDFFCAYSPERINPGDKKNTLENIVKIVSASNKNTLSLVNKLYSSIIPAGTHKVSSIKVAEASKVIENTQRDLNIGLINELSMIFKKMDINTKEVLKAAKTKWNFLNFSPGLVGGHCIGIDPYYLTYKSKKLGLNPKIILSARNVNDQMHKFVSKNFVKDSLKKFKLNKKIKILIIGLTFKENCNDLRNSKVFNLIDNLIQYNYKDIDLYEKNLSKQDRQHLLKIKKYNLITNLKNRYYDAIIIAVAHDYVIKLGYQKITNFLKEKNLFYDLKGIFSHNYNDFEL